MSARSSLSRFGAVLLLAIFARAAHAEAPVPPSAPATESGVAPAAPPPALEGVPALVVPEAPPAPALVRASDADKPERVPLAKRWWFWAGLGAAAMGVVLVGLFVGPRQPYTGNAQPGIQPVF